MDIEDEYSVLDNSAYTPFVNQGILWDSVDRYVLAQKFPAVSQVKSAPSLWTAKIAVRERTTNKYISGFPEPTIIYANEGVIPMKIEEKLVITRALECKVKQNIAVRNCLNKLSKEEIVKLDVPHINMRVFYNYLKNEKK